MNSVTIINTLSKARQAKTKLKTVKIGVSYNETIFATQEDPTLMQLEERN